MSAEIDAMMAYMEDYGKPSRMTSGLRDPRFPGDTSYHVKGLGTDWAGTVPWTKSVFNAELNDIWEYWMLKAGSLRELIYSGAPFFISKGRVRPIAQLDPALKKAHWNHVHVAVPEGWRYTKEIVVAVVADNPDIPNIDGPLQIAILQDSNGVCTGYAIFSAKTGELHGFGPGWRYWGRSEDLNP